MSFSQLISIVLARKWIAIWVFAITVLVATVVSFMLPKSYKATAAVIVNSKGSDPVTGFTLPASMMHGYLGTQVQIIQSRNVALKVVGKLGIISNPIAKKQFETATKGKGDISTWFADQFLGSLEVKPSRESSLIEISYQGADPNFAAGLANAFAEAYIETNLQLKTEPAKQAALFFDQQIKSLRHNVEMAQEKLSSYQKEHGIVFADERLDNESARLNELSSQLVQAQAQTYDSVSRQSQLKNGIASESPEILSNGMIQSLKSQLAQAQTRLSDIDQRLGSNHPQYQAAEADIANLRHLIEIETLKTTGAVGQTTKVSQQRESEIKAALAEQKDRVLKLKNQHDEMAVLMREVDGAQRVYDLALQRLGQTNMEGQSSQTDISILNPATPPLTHSSPKIAINILLSIFLGGLLAITFALVTEMLDRRVRSSADLLNLLDLPVLGDLIKDKQKLNFFSKINQFWKNFKFNKNASKNSSISVTQRLVK